MCYRLWREAAHGRLAEATPPEILAADLAPLALQLARSCVEAAQLRWLDAPPAAALHAARRLLQELGALDDSGILTPEGAPPLSLPRRHDRQRGSA